MLILKELGVTGGLRTLADTVGMEYDGKSLGIRCQDETSGPLTCNLGILHYDAENGLYATLDIRYPILCDHKALSAALTAAVSDGLTASIDTQKDPHHVAPNSRLIQCLLDAYHEETGLPGNVRPPAAAPMPSVWTRAWLSAASSPEKKSWLIRPTNTSVWKA